MIKNIWPCQWWAQEHSFRAPEFYDIDPFFQPAKPLPDDDVDHVDDHHHDDDHHQCWKDEEDHNHSDGIGDVDTDLWDEHDSRVKGGALPVNSKVYKAFGRVFENLYKGWKGVWKIFISV